MDIGRLLKRLASLGWFYVASLAIAIGALVGFAKLADEVIEGDVHTLNVAVLRGLHAHRHYVLDTIALGLSRLGDPAGATVVGGLAVLAFALRRRFLDAATLLLVLLGGTALSVTLKHSFRLPRPDLFPPIAPETGFGFPSAHAMLSSCFYGHLAAVLVLDGPRTAWRWWCATGLAFVALGISWSRLYLGVHWVSDVVAGGLVAVFWVASCLTVRRAVRSRLPTGLPSRPGSKP